MRFNRKAEVRSTRSGRLRLTMRGPSWVNCAIAPTSTASALGCFADGRGDAAAVLRVHDLANGLFVREVSEVDMRIGVSGASGHLGRAVVAELLQRADGHEVVAITRTPETVSRPPRGRFGDYNRPESLAEAYAGLRSSAHHHDRRSGTRKARGAERCCHRRGGEGGRQA